MQSFATGLESALAVLAVSDQRDTIQAIACSTARHLADAQGACLVLKLGESCHYLAESAISPLWHGHCFPLSGSIAGWTFSHHQGAYIHDIADDPRMVLEAAIGTFAVSMAIAPADGDQPTLAIGVYWDHHHAEPPGLITDLQRLATAAVAAWSTSARNPQGSLCGAGEQGESCYRLLFEGIDDALFVFQLDHTGPGRILQTNTSAVQRYGRSREELYGLRLGDLDADDEWAEEDWELLRREGRLCLQRTHCSASGDCFPVEIRCRLTTIDGHSTVVAAVRDITEQEQQRIAREELELQLVQAQKLEAVGQLAAGIAHDLNNMLAPIMGFGHILETKIPEGDPKRRQLRGMIEAGQRACDLTRQMLLFSRRQPLRREPTELPRVVEGLRPILEHSTNERVSLHYELGATCPVELDVGQIEQVLLNLVINAVDAMPNGGRVVVATGRRDEEGRTWALLQVRDTGTGMDQVTQERAFEPFFTTKGSGRGTGLGLATVYGIVRRHHGHVRIDSILGRGTTIQILLPPSGIRPSSATHAIPRSGSQRIPRIRRVLVCEDEPMVAEMTRDMLVTQSCEVELVHTAEAALERLEHGPLPDALLSDIMLPGIDGLELAAQIRRKYPAIHIALMSGYHDLMDRAEALALPILIKPFSLRQLVEVLRPRE